MPTEPSSRSLLYASDGRIRACWRVLLYIELYLGITQGVLALTRLLLYGNIYGYGAEGTIWRTTYLYHVNAAVYFVIFLLFFLATCWMRRYVDMRTLASLGLRRPAKRWYASVWVGLAVGCLPMLVGGGVMLATGQYLYEGLQWSWALPLYGLFMIFAAFKEELMTRGYLLSSVRESSNAVVGVVVSSAIFALLHFQNAGMWSSPWPCTNLFLGGVVLAQLYLISGNLWFVSAAHWGWNATQGLLFSVPVSGNPMPGVIRIRLPETVSAAVTGGEFGAEGSAVAVVPNAIFVILLGLWLWRWGGVALEKKETA